MCKNSDMRLVSYRQVTYIHNTGLVSVSFLPTVQCRGSEQPMGLVLLYTFLLAFADLLLTGKMMLCYLNNY